MGLKIDRAREIVTKFPNTPKASLAELLLKENPVLYEDKEDARHNIRKATGTAGKHHRDSRPALVKQEHYPNGRIYNPYELPEQDHYNHLPYKLNVKDGSRVGIICDIHIPYQDNEALTTTLDYLKKQKLTHLVINGDLLDCHELSTFEKDPNKRRFKEEIDIVKNFLIKIRSVFKTQKIVLKEGNHEERFLRFMRRKAPELLDFEVLSLPSLLGLKELDIDFISNKKVTQCGKLNIVHGHEFGHQIFSPVNPARGLFLRAKTNSIAGHHHITSSHSEKTLEDKPLGCYSIGCLCELHPEYRPINNWNHGFAIVEIVNNQGYFVVDNKKVLEGKIY